MSRRPGTASSSAARAKPQTLDSYVQAAIDASPAATSPRPKRSRRRRTRKQHEPATLFPNLLETKPAAPPTPPPAAAKSSRRKRRSKFKNAVLQSQEVPRNCKFRLRGLVTADDLEDEDEAAEVQEEARADFGRFGALEDVAIVRPNEEVGDQVAGDAVVTFRDAKDAAAAFGAFNGKVFGGKTVACAWETGDEKSAVVVVKGMVTSEELEDPDEAADVEEEVMEVVGKHGLVTELQLSKSTGDVAVTFSDDRDAEQAVEAINGSQYGGRVVSACLGQLSGEAGAGHESANGLPQQEARRIRTCIIQPTESPELQNLVGVFLKRLADLQERAHAQNPKQDKRSRRFVLGLREVHRGLLCNKIRLLVIATDLDGCEAVKETYVELVNIATEKEVPTLAPMNRRKLGRVLQKSGRMSCVGVYSIQGANDLFGQILKML